jgi:hypothetical protein
MYDRKVKQADLEVLDPAAVGSFLPMQPQGENPRTAYRELLCQQFVDPETLEPDDSGVPVWYRIELAAGAAVTIRIPHGLSEFDDLGNLVYGRVPDVIIPVRARNLLDDLTQFNFQMFLATNYNPAGGPAVPGIGWDTGWVADAEYVYLTLFNPNTKAEAEAKFFVYVEYTHSIVGNEMITGDYGVAYEEVPGGGAVVIP